jgi:hypothetical protein
VIGTVTVWRGISVTFGAEVHSIKGTSGEWVILGA